VLDAVIVDGQWREQLPDGCPPLTASQMTQQVLLRLVGPNPISDDDFMSHQALGFAKPDAICACAWSSCSMFLASIDRHRLRAMKRFKRLKDKTAVAHLRIDIDSGVGLTTDAHVDFWMRQAFDPCSNVQRVETL
jgi:hypothetical protein